jgi:hypothetical protein
LALASRKTLDSLPALDGADDWDENAIPSTEREKRWLELYNQPDKAWRQWMVESHTDHRRNLAFY